MLVVSAQEKLEPLVEQLEVAAGLALGVGVVVLGFGEPGGLSGVGLGERVAMGWQQIVIQGMVWMLAQQHSVRV